MDAPIAHEILVELRAIRGLLSAKNGADRLTRDQAAAALNVSTSTLDRMVKVGLLLRDQETGPIRFRSTDIEAFKLNGGAVTRRVRQRRASA